MPLPTKTPSHPICIMSAASAGVATPPAARCATGRRPCFRHSRSVSRGAWRSLARAGSSSSGAPRSRAISRLVARMWRTASTTFPVPASPLVRIMAAPSATRRRASPRWREPQTKGTVKGLLSMWCSSSAGVSTSLSSMQSTPRASRMRASTKWPMRALAMTGMDTASWISLILSGSAMRTTPPALRISEGMRSRAMTAMAPAFSAMRAWVALVTSMMTPRGFIHAKSRLDAFVPCRSSIQIRPLEKICGGVLPLQRA